MYRRREFLAGSLSLMAVPALSQEAGEAELIKPEAVAEETRPAWIIADIAPGTKVYITPDGTGDGLSWDSAAPIEALGNLAGRVAPGGQVVLLAEGDAFKVTQPIEIASPGNADAPVRILGRRRDGTAAPAVLVGTRKVWGGAETADGAEDASDFGGNTLFKLGSGTAHLHFSNLKVENFGTVIDMSGSDATGIIVEDVAFFNIRDGIYTDGDSAATAVTIRRFSGRGFSKKAVRFHGTSNNWLVEDCDLDSGWQYGDNFAVGIEAHDSAHGLRIVGGRTINCMDTEGDDPEQYWNGDGVASERGNYDIVIENHYSSGHTDSGYDLKSEQTELLNCVSESNKRNYRLWGGIGAEPMLLTGCSSLTPLKRGGSGGAHHIWVSGATGEEDVAGSVLFVDGVISGADQEEAIHVEGGNTAVHLVDTVAEINGGTLFAATDKTSVLIIGSARDAGVTAILTPPEVNLVAGAVKSIALEADAEASWRILSEDDVGAVLNGSELLLTGGEVNQEGNVVVQARDSAGRATPLTIFTQSVENPVAEGAVLSLVVAADGTLSDATGMHAIRTSDDAEVVDGAFHFRGKTSYFEVDASENFSLDGAFSIQTSFKIEDRDFALPADIMTVWNASGNKRSFRIGLSQDRAIAFYWSTDGRAQEEAVLVGPVLKPETLYTVMLDRGQSGIIRLYVDGAMVAKTGVAIGPLFAGRAPLRVAGRPDGKQAASGLMTSLIIVKGFAQCDSDSGCAI